MEPTFIEFLDLTVLGQLMAGLTQLSEALENRTSNTFVGIIDDDQHLGVTQMQVWDELFPAQTTQVK